MKTFEDKNTWGRKTNFVDDNNVLVGFDMDQSCCESFGWFLSRSEPTKINEGAGDIDPTGFNFDTSFFKETKPNEEYFDEGGMVIFRLTNGGDEIFLTLHNSHNGYYSHGFDVSVGGTIIQSGSI